MQYWKKSGLDFMFYLHLNAMIKNEGEMSLVGTFKSNFLGKPK